MDEVGRNQLLLDLSHTTFQLRQEKLGGSQRQRFDAYSGPQRHDPRADP